MGPEKIVLFLLTNFILSPLYSSNYRNVKYLKYDESNRKIFVYPEKFVFASKKLWKSISDKYSGNSKVQRHSYKYQSGLNFQWNIHGDYGVESITSNSKIVAIVDTGVVPHLSFENRLLDGADLISEMVNANDGDLRDVDARDPGDYLPLGRVCENGATGSSTSSWHGTHVAGIVAMGNLEGSPVGVSSDALILPVRVLGSCGGSLKDLADGILWAIGEKVDELPINKNLPDVINLSLGGGGQCPDVLQRVVDLAIQKDIAVIASAGNLGVDLRKSPMFPATCSGVLSVSAVAETGSMTSYSNFGGKFSVLAPGGSINRGIYSSFNDGLTTAESDSYQQLVGTSMAAPHVSGIIINLKNRYPHLSKMELANVIAYYQKKTGRPLKNNSLNEFIDRLDEENITGGDFEFIESGQGGDSDFNTIKKSSTAGCGAAKVKSNNYFLTSFFVNFFIYYFIMYMERRLRQLSLFFQSSL